MSKKIADALSTLFHPILLPTWGTLIYCFALQQGFSIFNSKIVWLLIGIVFGTTFCIPALLIGVLRLTKGIGSFKMETQAERFVPLIIVTLTNYLCFTVLKSNVLVGVINLFILGTTLLSSLSIVITAFWKISLHGIGWGGFCSFLFVLSTYQIHPYFFLFLMTILLSGFVGWARLSTNSHTPAEFYGGFALGFVAMTVFLLFCYH